MRKMVLLVCLLVAISTPALAGGGFGGGLCPGFGEGARVSLLDSCFDGTAHFAPAGVRLTVTNDGVIGHDYTAVDGSFGSGLLEGGETVEIDGMEPGIYRVYCTLHGTRDGDGMAGVLVLGEPAPETVAAAVNGVAPSPQGPGSGDETASEGGWVPVTAGAAAGVALAALAVAPWGLKRTRPGTEPAS